MIILKRAGQPGQQVVVFFSKMDFTRAQLGQQISNDKDNDQQDISHLAFFPNSRSVMRLVNFRIFFLVDRFLFFVKNVKSELFDPPEAAPPD